MFLILNIEEYLTETNVILIYHFSKSLPFQKSPYKQMNNKPKIKWYIIKVISTQHKLSFNPFKPKKRTKYLTKSPLSSKNHTFSSHIPTKATDIYQLGPEIQIQSTLQTLQHSLNPLTVKVPQKSPIITCVSMTVSPGHRPSCL